MKRFAFLFLALVAAVALFSGCLKTGADSTTGSIIGQWQCTKQTEVYYENNVLKEEETQYCDSQNGMFLEIRADYTYVQIMTSGGVARTTSGTWVKTADTLYLTDSKESETTTLKIESLTDTSAVVVFEYISEGSSKTYKYVYRYFMDKVA